MTTGEKTKLPVSEIETAAAATAAIETAHDHVDAPVAPSPTSRVRQRIESARAGDAVIAAYDAAGSTLKSSEAAAASSEVAEPEAAVGAAASTDVQQGDPTPTQVVATALTHVKEVAQEAKSASKSLEERWEEFQRTFDRALQSMVEVISSQMKPQAPAEHRQIDVDEFKRLLASKGRIAVLTGAGISVASGIPTYRGNDGVWTIGSANYKPQEIATREFYENNPDESWSYWVDRHNMCQAAEPNTSHMALAELERIWPDLKTIPNSDAANGPAAPAASQQRDNEGDEEEEGAERMFTLISQNVDNLHRRAGSSPLEIHGNMRRALCLNQECLARCAFPSDSTQIPTCTVCGAAKLRPHVLFFDECYSEELYRSASATRAVDQAEMLIVIGTTCTTSLPRAILRRAAAQKMPIVDINPNPNNEISDAPLLQLVAKSDAVLPKIVGWLKRHCSAKKRSPRKVKKSKKRATKITSGRKKS